jgi:hypothetical protein
MSRALLQTKDVAPTKPVGALARLAARPSAVEDPPAADHYAVNLAEVTERRPMVAREGIYDIDGTMLVKKGGEIDYATARMLLQHRLTHPLSTSVQFEAVIDRAELMACFERVLRQYPDLALFHERLGFQSDYRSILDRCALSAEIIQKLTVMSVRFPVILEQAVLGAWFSTALARQLGMKRSELVEVHLAALVRDCGMMHIDPHLIERPNEVEFQTAEWRALQSHVVVSRLMLSDIGGVSPEVANAVLEHHERYDGSGYPTGKEGKALGVYGQILGMSDSLLAIRLKQFTRNGRALGDAAALVQLCSGYFLPDVVVGTLALLRQAGLPLTNQCSDVPKLCNDGILRGERLEQAALQLDAAPEFVGTTPPAAAKARYLRSVVKRAREFVVTSGLGDPQLRHWLRAALEKQASVAPSELLQIELQQNELFWQLKRICQHVEEFAELEQLPQESPVLGFGHELRFVLGRDRERERPAQRRAR